MGNYLSGIAPSQVCPIEHYLNDFKDLHFDANLGSTRFMKVARVRTQEGFAVVKVFAIHDPSLPLALYKEKLDETRNLLRSSFNCLPFRRVVIADKCGLLFREYVKYSLYDRISTRPFLKNIEKTWITFQILYALNQCHRLNVCHGDLKLENVMITSWNWVLLADFASFKPTFLPEDNPADYSYFFDTSRRDACCISPERFVKSYQNSDISSTSSTISGSGSTSMFNELSNIGNLTPSMDIFSAGCVLIELWTDGKSPFNLSQLLSYKTDDNNIDSIINEIENNSIRDLVRTMIDKDPNVRKSSEVYLDQERGKLFPEYFYSFLQSYMSLFSTTPILPCDEKLSRLCKDINHVYKVLYQGENDDSNGLLLFITLITSCIRGLHHCKSKLNALHALGFLSPNVNKDIVLDRIVPYVIYLLHDSVAKVRSFALVILVKCLESVGTIPITDVNIFPDYILPELSLLIRDQSILVRRTFAAYIGSLAKISMQFLEPYKNKNENNQLDNSNNGFLKSNVNYDLEVEILQKTLKQIIYGLLTDQHSIVKLTLIVESVVDLCEFLKKQKINDLILSHMITFMNDKDDAELRGLFFEFIVRVTSFMGKYSCLFLFPLFLQGLKDHSEFVIVKCIRSMSEMASKDLLNFKIANDLIKEVMPFLIHPNLWIQHSTAFFMSKAVKYVSDFELYLKIIPMMEPILQYKSLQVNNVEILLSFIMKPIPRPVYDSIIKFPNLENILNALSCKSDENQPDNINIKKIIHRLKSDGMTEEDEKKVLFLKHHLIKMQNLKSPESSSRLHSGVLSTNNLVQLNTVILKDNRHDNWDYKFRFKNVLDNENYEWSKMFSPRMTYEQEAKDFEVDGQKLTIPSTSTKTCTNDTVSCNSLQERSFIQYEVADCRRKLNELIDHQTELYNDALIYEEYYDQDENLKSSSLVDSPLRGVMVNQLQEHTNMINCLTSLPNTNFFASCSNDGKILLWDVSKMSGLCMESRSKQSFSLPDSLPLISLCSNNYGTYLSSSADNGQLLILRVSNDSSKMVIECKKQLDTTEDGFAVDCDYLRSVSANVLIYATLYGTVYGWDLRSPDVAFRLKNSLKSGIIMSLCQGAYRSWLAVGTSSGLHIAWDLRFQLPIATISHPNSARVRKIIKHPTEHSCLISSVQGNNETSIWNLETGFRNTVLWASPTPSLSNINVSNHSICAMYAGRSEKNTFVLTAGTDQRIRYWNLSAPESSHLLVASGAEKLPHHSSVTYKSRVIDGTCVIRETDCMPSQSGGSSPKSPTQTSHDYPKNGLESVPPGHTDWISSLIMCKTSRHFYMLTGDRSGVIKVWK